MLGRHYLWVVSRFASVDLARDGWNLYAYVGNNPIRFIDPDGYRAANLYGEVHDVEPGDVVTLVKTDDANWPTHTVIVGDFSEASEGEVPDALVYEATPQDSGSDDAFQDSAAHQPILVNSNDSSAGAGLWNAETNDVGSIVANRKADGSAYSPSEVRAAVEAVGPIIYSNQHGGSFGKRCDCAGYANQVVFQLNGAVGPPPQTGNLIIDWLRLGRR